MSKRKSFSINSYSQFEKFINNKRSSKETIVIFIKSYLVQGFGIDWVNSLIQIIKKNYKKYNIKFYVDCGNDHGLCIQIMNKNIDYLKLKSSKTILSKVKQIAKKNKVVLNPNFDVVEKKKY